MEKCPGCEKEFDEHSSLNKEYPNHTLGELIHSCLTIGTYNPSHFECPDCGYMECQDCQEADREDYEEERRREDREEYEDKQMGR